MNNQKTPQLVKFLKWFAGIVIVLTLLVLLIKPQISQDRTKGSAIETKDPYSNDLEPQNCSH